MLQLGLLLALVTSLLGAGTWFIHSQREIGREECRASHAEAARMAELRSRERAGAARTQLENDRTQIGNRDVEARKALVGADRSCVDDRVRDALNERIRQGRTTPRPDDPVSPSKGN